MTTTYVVKFIDFTEKSKVEFEYDDLLDALKVARDTPIEGKPAFNKEYFNTNIPLLLSSGFLYHGKKTTSYPDGDKMMMLMRRENNVEYVPHTNILIVGLPRWLDSV